MYKNLRGRKQYGAALAEGVVALWLIVSITVASISLLINSGMSMFYKQKIAYVAMQTATYTAQMKMHEDKKAKGEELAKKLLGSMGFNTAQADVQVSEVTIEEAPCIKVEITVANLPLFHGTEAGMMPFSVTLGDSAVAIKQQAPEAYVWLSNNPKMSGYLIPVVRLPPGGVSASGLPYVIP
jgi:carbon starvation protein CstA